LEGKRPMTFMRVFKPREAEEKRDGATELGRRQK